jgi:hypothetical protein
MSLDHHVVQSLSLLTFLLLWASSLFRRAVCAVQILQLRNTEKWIKERHRRLQRLEEATRHLDESHMHSGLSPARSSPSSASPLSVPWSDDMGEVSDALSHRLCVSAHALGVWGVGV